MIVCITGMHRSGTSMVARLLNLCGVYLGPDADIYPPAADNTEGFWENKNFVEINNAILEELGGSWDFPPVMNAGWHTSPQFAALKTRAQELIHQFDGHKTWGWKDPRCSLTMPFWQALIPDLKVAVCLRNPYEVAQSLSRRGYASNAFSYNLWQSYHESLLSAVPAENRIITHYESYFLESKTELKRLLDFIELPVSENLMDEACRSASSTHKHNRSTLDDALTTKIPEKVLQLYLDLCSQAGATYWGGHYPDLQKTLPIAQTTQPELTPTGLLLRLSEQKTLLKNVSEENLMRAKAIKSKDEKLHQLQSRLTGTEYDLRALQDSMVVKALLRYRKFIEKSLPEGTKRRKLYAASTRAVRVLFVEGPRGIWNRIQSRRRSMAGANNQKKIANANAAASKKSKNVEFGSQGKLAEIYSNALAMANGEARSEYVPLAQDRFSAEAAKVKLIAFYLPQYHPFPENDEWWGKGFTEWTNVSKAVPQYTGHYQPHLPGELGFYDLRLPEVQRRQVELAKQYGIFGFSFYYYWFNGKRLLERPLDQFIADPEIDFPFCLCWANENWTRRWDGQESDILIGQDHSVESDIAFIRDIAPYFRHKNYIKVDGRPVLIVYRPQIMPDPIGTAKRWKEYCQETGIGDVYLVAAQTFGLSDPRQVGFDAAVEFPPHGIVIPEITKQVEILNPNYAGKVYNYQHVVGYMMQKSVPDYPLFRTVMTAWDNTARRQNNAHIFVNSSPALYQSWLTNDIEYTQRNLEEKERFVFINAWNEWAEGTHLEPDRKYGYAFLQSTMDALRASSTSQESRSLPIANRATRFEKITKQHDTAVILHLYYPELWDEINTYLANLQGEFDFFVSIPNNVKFDAQQILQPYPQAFIYRCENQGRDIAPFLKIFSALYPLNYQYICKIHTKKTTHRENGEQWRKDLLNKLLGSSQAIQEAKKVLDSKITIGLLAPKGHILSSNQFMAENKENVASLAQKAGISFEGEPNFDFIAGSMFWFKPLALSPLVFMNIKDEDFGPEKGLKDGTLAHSFERFIGLLALKNGFQIVEFGENTPDSPKYNFAAPMLGRSIMKVNQDPIIVYQVGKVGSRTILLSLQKAYKSLHLDVPVHHVHVLENLDEMERNLRKNFANPVDNLAYIKKSKELRQKIDSDLNKRWKIISLVREPVARNIGSFFQNLTEYIPDWKERYQNGKLSLDDLQDYFLKDQSIHIAADWWFDKQLKPLFGIDVFESDFPIEVGYKIYKSPPRASLLLMRLEDLNECAEHAMFEFLGLEDFELHNSNVGDEKDYAELYQAFKEKPLPAEYLEKMYSTRSARHFYSADELRKFAARWRGEK